MFSLLLLGVALAADPVPTAPLAPAGPSWRWEAGSPRVYAFDTCVELPEPLTLDAGEQLQARVDRVQLQLVLSCEAAVVEPGGWALACLVQELTLRAEALPGDEAALAPVLVALDARLSAAAIELPVRRDGRQRVPVLHGLERREQPIAALGSLLFERALLGLELTLPEDDALRWGESSPGLMSYLPRARSVGAARLQSEATPSADGARWEIRSRGRGVLRADALSGTGGRRAPAALSLNMTFDAAAVLDLADGALVSRDWALVSHVTPSAAFDASATRRPYAAAGALRRLGPGETAVFPESAPLAPGERSGACAALEASRPTLEAAFDQPLGAGP